MNPSWFIDRWEIKSKFTRAVRRCEGFSPAGAFCWNDSRPLVIVLAHSTKRFAFPVFLSFFCIMLSLLVYVKDHSLMPALFCLDLVIRFPLVSLPFVSPSVCLCLYCGVSSCAVFPSPSHLHSLSLMFPLVCRSSIPVSCFIVKVVFPCLACLVLLPLCSLGNSCQLGSPCVLTSLVIPFAFSVCVFLCSLSQSPSWCVSPSVSLCFVFLSFLSLVLYGFVPASQ